LFKIDGHKKNWFHLNRFYEANDDLTSDNLDVGVEMTGQNMNYVVEEKATYGKNSHVVEEKATYGKNSQ
jgi:hypothetical protein